MARLLAILTLILSIVLFPPAVLALISNNAVPGDATYPIKRGLEDVIFAVASINPVSKAWFAAARSDRRFEEFTVLTKRGDKVSETLNELVNQTDSAASEIDKIESSGQKKVLLGKLSNSIQKYDQGLEKVSKIEAPVETPLPQASPSPSSTPLIDDLERQQREIAEARRRLEEIIRRIEEGQRRLEEEERLRGSTSVVASPSPSVTVSPSPSPTPVPSPSPTMRPGRRGDFGAASLNDLSVFSEEESSDVGSTASSPAASPSPSPSPSPSI